MARKPASPFWQRLDIIQQCQLKVKHKMLLTWLWKYAGDDLAWPQQETLARDTGVSARELQRLLAELREAEIIFVTRHRERTTYRIDWQAVEQAEPIKRQRKDVPVNNSFAQVGGLNPDKIGPSRRVCSAQVGESDSPMLASPTSYRNSNETPVKLQGEKREPQSAVIERIYQAYPKKTGKAKALKAIAAALKRPKSHTLAITADDLLAAVEEFARAVKGANPQYIPYPASWFNAGRWEDDRASWQTIGRDKSNSRTAESGSARIHQQMREFAAWAAEDDE